MEFKYNDLVFVKNENYPTYSYLGKFMNLRSDKNTYIIEKYYYDNWGYYKDKITTSLLEEPIKKM